jgi:hypothetical protein
VEEHNVIACEKRQEIARLEQEKKDIASGKFPVCTVRWIGRWRAQITGPTVGDSEPIVVDLFGDVHLRNGLYVRQIRRELGL